MHRYFFSFLFILFSALLSAQSIETDAQKTQQLIEAGRFTEAGQHVAQLVQRATSTDDASALHDLGILFDDQGLYAEAELLLKGALKILRAKKAPIALHCMVDLATLYKNMGKYIEAEDLYEPALEMVKDKFERAVILNNQGLLYQEQGRNAPARKAYEESLAIYEELVKEGELEKDDPYLSAPLFNLARLYRKQENYVEAERLQKRSLAIDEKDPGKDHPDYALSLDGLATIYRDQGGQNRYAEAERLYKQALDIYEKHLDKNHPRTADTANGLGVLYAKQQQFTKAEPFYDRAIDIYNVNPTMEARLGQIWYRDRANLYWEMKRSKEAVTDLKRAMDLSLKIRQHSSGSKEDVAETFAGYYDLFVRMVDWQYELGDRGDLSEAYEAMERSRAQGLLELLHKSNSDLLAGAEPEIAKKLYDAEAAAVRGVTFNEKQLANLPPSAEMTATQRRTEEKLKDDLKLAKTRLDDARGAILVASPALRQTNEVVSFETVQKKFSEEKFLALEYIIGKEKSYVLVYGAGTEPMLLPLSLNEREAEFFGTDAGPLTSKSLESILNRSEDGVLQLVGNLTNAKSDGSIPAKKTLDKLAALWHLLVPEAEIRSKLLDRKSFTRLLVLPDGALAPLPFEMLVVEYDVANPQYLLDKGPAVIYAPSASMYYNLSRPNADAKTPHVLTVGNPDYNASDARADTRSAPLRKRMGPFLQRLQFSQLNETEKETRWIEESSQKNRIPVTRLVGREATEKNIREHVTGQTIVHLACHGLVESDPGGGLFCALAVTVGDPNDPKNDGFIELAEMLDRDFDLQSCELAVLSACKTNLGRDQQGEGTWSMGRGMLASGATRVVTTDWEVADESSALLMAWFIDAMNSSSDADYASALQASKRDLRYRQDKPEWRHPFYWAPFVLIGPH